MCLSTPYTQGKDWGKSFNHPPKWIKNEKGNVQKREVAFVYVE